MEFENQRNDQVASLFSEGKTKEEVYSHLLSQGWKIEDIQKEIDLLGGQTRNDEDKHSQQKKVTHILLIIGVVLIGAGIFSFIASNWRFMDKVVKISIIVFFMMGSYSIGWYLREIKGYVKSGTALILLGSIIYGAGIFLIGQMFNIRANWPDGFILWMLGVLSLAWAIELLELFYLAVPLGFISIIGYPTVIAQSFFDNYLFTSSALLVGATIIVFISAIIARKKVDLESEEFY